MFRLNLNDYISKNTRLNLAAEEINAIELKDYIIPFLKLHPEINELVLISGSIQDEGAILLAESLDDTNITILNLASNDITCKGAWALAKLKKLISLDLSKNKIGPYGALALANNTTLKKLELYNNHIGNAVKVFGANKGLKQLGVLNNFIWGDTGIQGLGGNLNLEKLNCDKILEEEDPEKRIKNGRDLFLPIEGPPTLPDRVPSLLSFCLWAVHKNMVDFKFSNGNSQKIEVTDLNADLQQKLYSEEFKSLK